MKRVALVLLAAAAAHAAHAGQTCEPQALTTEAVVRGMALAQATAEALDASQADVVLLARAGQDLSKWNLRWSHLGFAYRADDGRWRVLHKLNQCGSDRAAVYRQGLGEFFLDQPHRYEAAYAVPAPEVQARLLPLLRDNGRAAAWHVPRYSMVAYVWSSTYQQSNQWVLETLAGAMEPGATTRRKAQAWLMLKDYRPGTLNVGPLTRLGARVGSAHIAFDDHPDALRWNDRIVTVSADSVFAWLPRSGLGGAPVGVRAERSL